ncbi:MlaC/ttg2D family ABC transporter substrate-binding protein [Roseospirillum parvum]|uniref:Phospholipid transport system substrate-binding protein n=1 Tax=Roseospirillum parvum TaxID=83401 RepID=A0A1G8C1P3_9PROT|nr:ABC transporter substrate-binding protein [Roseospirillum parvum]SDH39382.1 phospholipid transport system substrate-binding protein [Roseospirillum parvum]
MRPMPHDIRLPHAVLALAVCLLLAVAAPARAAEQSPEAFVDEVAREAIENVFTADIPRAEKVERFRTMFTRYFDVATIGRFVVGSHWRVASPEQKKAFIEAFREMNVLTWARRFDEYGGQTLDVVDSQPDDNGGALVSAEIVQPSGPPVIVTWRLRSRDDGWQVIDLVVEGVSMAITYRSEYASVIRQSGGIDGLIEMLDGKVAELKQQLLGQEG